ncbi:MAG: sulfurtransferase-like selenium metabolism protein YedF [Syntrophobacteraceae bacterium]|nr:sulfurtransferase-like selenium metabolism protein YedF [Syntrophobacteraceae bacterium]
MADQTLDCRGLACPRPVLQVKEILDGGNVGRLTVLLDNEAARENVSRFMARMGYEVRARAVEDGLEVTGEKVTHAGACETALPLPEAAEARKIAVLVGTDRMGSGDDVLGAKLLFNFLATLREMGSDLWRLIFLNAGVKLAIDGSDSLQALLELESNGVHILVCGTCLGHFNILERKRVGETTNMLDIVTALQLAIVTALQLADKVVSVT